MPRAASGGMSLRVILYGILRSIAGTKELRLDSSTVSEAEEELSRRFGPRMREYLYDQDAVESLTVVLNGRVLSKDEARAARLQGEDVLELLSPIGGG